MSLPNSSSQLRPTLKRCQKILMNKKLRIIQRKQYHPYLKPILIYSSRDYVYIHKTCTESKQTDSQHIEVPSPNSIQKDICNLFLFIFFFYQLFLCFFFCEKDKEKEHLIQLGKQISSLSKKMGKGKYMIKTYCNKKLNKNKLTYKIKKRKIKHLSNMYIVRDWHVIHAI